MRALSTGFDVIVLGAGAAGLMAAARANQRGRRVLLLERNAEPGAKILISGGGRCNFTNRVIKAESFIGANPAFCRSALARFGPEDFLDLLRAHRIDWYEKTLGQLFCEGTGSAKKIVAMLLAQAQGVALCTGVDVSAVRRAEAFVLDTSIGMFHAPALIVATGGLSIPKLGVSDLAYRLATQFGLRLEAPRAGLVPLTFGATDLARFGPLAGVSLPVRAAANGPGFAEALLFTHRGLSGPAILQASSYWRAREALTVDFTAAIPADFLLTAKQQRPQMLLTQALSAYMPDRLAKVFAGDWAGTPLQGIKATDLRALAQGLAAFRFFPSGTEGFTKAEVTLGGVDTRDLLQNTMMARHVPGLYFVGEAVDITGWLGGYNFQWAWASGWCAGDAA